MSAPKPTAMRIRGARVHNLRGVDLDLPLGGFIAVTGVSGSGKSSLAFDLLYAEGHRRYVESFPVHARQFLPKLDRPAVDVIDGIPPAIAVGQFETLGASATVASATGMIEHVRLLYAWQSKPFCPKCGAEVRRYDAASVVAELAALPAGSTFWIGFTPPGDDLGEEVWQSLKAKGYLRAEADGKLFRLGEEKIPKASTPVRVVVDRLTVPQEQTAPPGRWFEGVEAAFAEGDGVAWCRINDEWRSFPARLACSECGFELPSPSPALFHASNPESQCLACEGTGVAKGLDPSRVIPDPSRTLREGAVATLAGVDRAADLAAFLKGAKQAGLSIDLAIGEMTDAQREILWHGTADGAFGGIDATLAKVEGKRSTLGKFQSDFPCKACNGKRLKPEVLAFRVAGRDFGDFLRQTVDEAEASLEGLNPLGGGRRSGVPGVRRRLQFLHQVGLGYLTLDRLAPTLSTGEARRIALTSVFGADLAETLYVLDEPTAGLHPEDSARLVDAIRSLKRDGNTTVVVEHDLDVVQAADHVVELGPGAGAEGGRVVYQGDPEGLAESEESATAEFLQPPEDPWSHEPAKPTGWMTLRKARANNLAGIDVRIPLGVMTGVAGVSGAGKSTLVFDVLQPAVERALGDREKPMPPCEGIDGLQRIDEVVAVVGRAVGRSMASNAATYLKFFDDVRKLFAETLEARTNGFTAAAFSFNQAGGRCERCQGAGVLTIDMQFLPSVHMTCPDCGGARYEKKVLDVKFRGRNIAEVLALTVREAFSFFRGETRIQERLKALLDVGLDYLQLGQPAGTLSGGEAQRLRLASFLGGRNSRRTLFLFEEPTTGLHPADVEHLVACLRSLQSVGHTLVVIEHEPQFLAACDHVIELGPGAGSAGGKIVAEGSPQEVSEADTPTGRALRRWAGEEG